MGRWWNRGSRSERFPGMEVGRKGAMVRRGHSFRAHFSRSRDMAVMAVTPVLMVGA